MVVMGESTRDDDEEENSVVSRTGSVLLLSCRNVIVKAGHGCSYCREKYREENITREGHFVLFTPREGK